MRKYIIVYAYKDKDGTTGYGNDTIKTDVTVSGYSNMVKKLKRENGHKDVVVLNMIPLEEEQGLQQAFTFENFKKLLYFVNGCVGEGWQIGKVDAGELLYFDILKDIVFDDKKFDAETDKFLGVEE